MTDRASPARAPAADQPDTRIFRFGDAELDLALQEIRRGGVPVATRPKVLAVLSYLIAQRHRAVSRQELLEKLWDGAIVGDAALTTIIKEVRHVVGDTGDAQSMVRTVRGHGYRFVGTVREQSREAEPTAQQLSPDRSASRPPRTDPCDGNTTNAQYHGGEYKLACVLCVELPTTPPPEKIDTESLHEGKQAFYATCSQIASELGGHVLQTNELRATLAFGAPTAHEDYMLRAAVAATHLMAQLTALPARLRQSFRSSFLDQPRIGIHCGRLLISRGSARGTGPFAVTAVGDTQALADQLQRKANAGQILLSAYLAEQLGDAVEVRPCRQGASGEIQQLLRVTQSAWHSEEGADGRGGSLFVGRDTDLAVLRRLRNTAYTGRGQVLGLQGPPGIGKTRLCREFVERLPAEGRLLEMQCSSVTGSTPYAPILALLRRECQLKPSDAGPMITAQVTRWLAANGVSNNVAAPLAWLLGDTQSAPDLNEMSPPALRALVLQTLCDLVGKLAPLVFVLEDAHWIDASSDEWLAQLVGRLARLPIFVLVTYRPEYRPAWIHHSFVTQHGIQPLETRFSEQLLERSLDSGSVSPQALQRVAERAEGNPLFLHQLARVLSQGEGGEALPTTLQAMLTARIDRLSASSKHFLQVAAVCGQLAPLSAVSAVAQFEPERTSATLDELGVEELLYVGESELGPALVFNHILTQEAAYAALASSVRRQLHAEIADILLHEFGPACATRPELLAHHYAGAAQHTRAIEQWVKAGHLANAQSANQEALNHVAAGRALLSEIRQPKLRVGLELGLQLVEGAAFVPTRGYGAEAVQQVYERARELCESVGDAHSLFLVLNGLAMSYLLAGRFERCEQLCHQLLDLRELGPIARPNACAVLGLVYNHRAQLQEAIDCFADGVRAYRPGDHRAQTFSAGQDPCAVCLSFGALANQLRGDFKAALDLSRQALALTEQLKHPFTSAMSYFARAGLASMLGDADTCERYSQQSADISAHYGFPHWLGGSLVLHGWATVNNGNASGIEEMQRGLAIQQQCGARAAFPVLCAHAAEAMLLIDHVDDGIEAVETGLATIAMTGEKFHEADLYRLRGECRLRKANDQGKRAGLDDVRHAWRLAEEQDIPAWRLRTAVSLMNHLPNAENRRRLKDAMEPIKAGESSRDFREAQALLAPTRHC